VIRGLARLAQPVLLTLDPETAHRAALAALRRGLVPRQPGDAPSLRTKVLGLDLPHPFGTAAGFDKDAEVVDEVLALGFGFHEVGGVTPRPQPGNPRPRVFRLRQDRALINRLGFNNDGVETVRRRLASRRSRGAVGVNLGANKDTDDKAADYVLLVERLSEVADYFTLNVSSPNTPGLRDLQRGDALKALLERVGDARRRVVAGGAPRRPILLKIAPDLTGPEFDDILRVVRSHGVDGLVLSNTTLDRGGLRDQATAREAGGLSGAPLFRRSTALLAAARLALGPDMVLIGVGGVVSPRTAFTKILAGANLVQLYTGLVYEGMDLLGDMKRHAAEALAAEGLDSISQAVGREAERWAAEWKP